MKFFIEVIDEILDYLVKEDNFMVSSHVNPDGDNIGSSLAMYRFLQKIDKNVEYVLDDEYPSSLEFLRDDSKLVSNKSEIKNYTLIALDAGDYNRICVDENILKNANKIICIDHHHTNSEYADLAYVDVNESSTCQMVFNILTRFDERFGEDIICEKIATPLYTGLVTDTGNFQYSNADASSLIMASNLLDRGAKKEEIIENVFQKNSISYYRILGHVLNNMELVDNKIAVGTVYNKDLEDYDIKYDDIDSITPYTRDIDGVELGIFVKEKEPGVVKLSFRSKSYVDCTQLSRVFGGGGHIRAAGATVLDKTVEQVKELVIKEARKFI